MSKDLTQRLLTEDECAQLRGFLVQYPSRWGRAASNILVSWAVSMLAAVVLLGFLTWIGKQFLHIEFGRGWGIGTLLLMLPITFTFACVSTIKWLRSWPDIRPLIHADISQGIAVAEQLQVTELRILQEPEHGGLMYFLHTSDDRVFVLFDHESQQLGIDGQNPLDSSFHPQEFLSLVRAPNSRFVLGKAFTGKKLERPDPIEITARPENWPQTEEFCEIPWSDLERKLAS